MSFAIFSDSSCNLPKAQLEEFQVQIISSSYEREGKLITCPPYPEDFDGHEYYNFLRNKGVVKTSLIPAAQMEDAFRPVLLRVRMSCTSRSPPESAAPWPPVCRLLKP